jgi:hypothetical protein
MMENRRGEPWEVLYREIMERSDDLWFHIGKLTTINRGPAQLIRMILADYYEGKEYIIKTRIIGGEVLTRSNSIFKNDIGLAFSRMPEEKMAETFPILMVPGSFFIRGMLNIFDW